jgi:hypothetical protein
MIDPLAELKAYLAARITEYSSSPGLCAESIAEYRRLLSVAETSPGDYMKEASDMFASAKAEQLDRYAAMVALYRELGIDGCAGAYGMILEAVRKSTGYADMNYNIGRAHDDARPLINRETAKRDTLAGLIGALLYHRVSVESKRAESREAVRKLWRELQSLDPGVTWEKITATAAYRRCLYYDSEHLGMIGSWLAEAIS